MIRRLVGALDSRLGSSGVVVKALRYVFPDHWTFMLGEIALYAFIVLVATGVYLTFFFEPSTATHTVYHGPYHPLDGVQMTPAYRSTLDISTRVRAGLLMRQTHHWAALVFVAAIVLHMLRVFFTGAFRKPRDVTYVIGVVMLMLAILEGFAGYSLGDDLLSGMGLAIAYGVALSIPVIGGSLAFLIWGGTFGSPAFEPRLYIAHVLIFPIVIAVLLSAHLALVMRHKHTQFRGPGRSEHNVVGTPLWPGYALRSGALLFAVTGVLLLLGGLVQINPIWQWGPYEPWLGTNGAQPDWYIGWLIGALRLMPGFDVHVGNFTLIGNPFFGGVLFPTVVFATILAWPWLERLLTRDRAAHNLLDRPRDRPGRTAAGVALFTWVATIFFAGAADRFVFGLGIPYHTQVWVFRVLALVLPIAGFLITYNVCRELKRLEMHPLRRWTGDVVTAPDDGTTPAADVERGQ